MKTRKMNPMKKIALLFVLTCIGASIIVMPAYGTRIESGSSIDTSVVNIKTSTNSRFIVSGDTPVELNYNIRVTDLDGVPSKGKISTFFDGIIREGRGSTSNAFEEIEINERTSMDGYITLFDKEIRYRSGATR